ncbi:Piezo-type mechanosensitive ion channel component 2 [Portunus trituberculatus]|uniref:Piezo-type mechanosensitive ion channel component 2 n=1 Tax=Portunus trituberculatus TaxID=210409 RepID=A0A5B7D0X7_PORTR|nr:Piezo-type mechanosensitive ion channel component 2 [Portunus trituberculatus]
MMREKKEGRKGRRAVLRFSLMSFAYLGMVMVVPLLPAPTFHTMRGTYLAVAVIGAAGVMVPSLLSAIYFLVFVVTATYCSLNNPLGRRFGYVCRGVMVVAGVHLLCLYVYQTQWAQHYLPPASLAARLLGMTAVVETDCQDPRSAPLATDEWSRFLNPVLLLLLYYVLSFESQFLLSNKVSATVSVPHP